jgi:tetratricopeptide (TPR) repeat protein
MTRFGGRSGRLLLVAAGLPLLLWWGRPAVLRNRVFVALNHLPSLFTAAADPTVLAAAEAQLTAALGQQPGRASTRRMLALVQRAQGEEITQPATISAVELLDWGRQKQRLGAPDESAYLYRWATEVAPDLGDAWYYLGRLQEAEEAWAEALDAYQRAAASSTWRVVGRSDVYVALGDLYRTRWPEGRSDAARESYRQALAIAHFSEAHLAAAAHYGLGELLLWREDDPAAAAAHYRAALALTPADHWVRLRLGYALYWGHGDVAAAETEIRAAIDQWPDERSLKWPYYYLGELYEDAGLTAKAVAAYEQALALDPADAHIMARLVAIRGR